MLEKSVVKGDKIIGVKREMENIVNFFLK